MDINENTIDIETWQKMNSLAEKIQKRLAEIDEQIPVVIQKDSNCVQIFSRAVVVHVLADLRIALSFNQAIPDELAGIFLVEFENEFKKEVLIADDFVIDPKGSIKSIPGSGLRQGPGQMEVH